MDPVVELTPLIDRMKAAAASEGDDNPINECMEDMIALSEDGREMDAIIMYHDFLRSVECLAVAVEEQAYWLGRMRELHTKAGRR